MTHAQVLIVGGGMAGLACAKVLEEARLDWHLFEAAPQPGGRVRTGQQDGFLLDHGFQVLLAAYPEARTVMDFHDLQLAAFPAGARVFHRNRWHRFADPLRQPTAAFASLFAPFASLSDLVKLARWKYRARRASLHEILARPDSSTARALVQAGFSGNLRHHFLEPFYRGILLDPSLDVSSRMLELTFKYFSEDAACLPAQGMAALPRQLAAGLPINRLHFNTPVEHAEPGQIRLSSGKTLLADEVVLATDAATTAQWLPDRPAPPFHATTCLYFQLPAEALPPHAHYLHLCANQPETAPVNHLAFPSAIQPAYAPAGQHLASVNCLHPTDHQSVLPALHHLFAQRVDAWKPLAAFSIPHALPARPCLQPPEPDPRLHPGLLLAGDQLGLPSLDSALRTGRRAAEALLAGQSSA